MIVALFFERRVDADAARQIGGEQPVGVQAALDLQEVPIAGVDAIKLIGSQDLVLGEVNLAAVADGRIDEAVDGFAAGGLVVFFGVELEVEAVAVLGERDQAVVRRVGAQDGRDGWAGGRLADAHQLDDRRASERAWKGELDRVPVGAAYQMRRRHGEAGFETESEKKLAVG